MSVTPTRVSRHGKIEHHYDELVARDGRTFMFLKRLFFDPDKEWAGAVGARMCPVTQSEYEHRCDEYRDPEYSPLRYVYDEVSPSVSWETWIERELQDVETVLDPSYVSKFGETVKEKAREDLGIDAEYVECIGGGRMFSAGELDYDTVYNDDLLRRIADTESDGVPMWAEHYI